MTNEVSKLIVNKSETLTKGYLVAIEKPGKDPKVPLSYRPVILLSAYRKLVSQILLNRIEPILENTMLPNQFAYRSGRSTGDIVLPHKYFVLAARTKRLEIVCAGIYMSKAFDTVDRKKLSEILKKRGVQKWDVILIVTLLTNTSLSIKQGKQISNVFKTNTGVPQGD